MSNIKQNIDSIKLEIGKDINLVAVSKTKPLAMLIEAYESGHRIFGENYVQELVEKQPLMPADTQWHMIGHLQSNKVKFIAPFVRLIHSVDSEKLYAEIAKQAAKSNRIIEVLIQVHIAQEESKTGFSFEEAQNFFESKLSEQVKIRGLMGMASFTEDQAQVAKEFRSLKLFFDKIKKDYPMEGFDLLSMGMSGDYPLAISCGSNMIRVGSKIFGGR